jgi:hypothetical protein
VADDTWLEPGTVTAVLGSGLSEQLDMTALGAVLPGVRDWVEGKRKDLNVTAGDPPVTTFEPTPSVVLGAAMLAHRIYQRRTTPLGILGATEDGYTGIIREDPDIARLLGIGAAGRFVFGGYNPTTTTEAVV